MSRSGYTDDFDDPWQLICWRGAVASAIRGKRGQALLKELEAALLALPEKKLIVEEFANAEAGAVCALGAVALKRRLDKGMSLSVALKDVEEKYPEGAEAEAAAAEMNVAGALVKEITFINDDEFCNERTPEERYMRVLGWVRKNIKSRDSREGGNDD